MKNLLFVFALMVSSLSAIPGYGQISPVQEPYLKDVIKNLMVVSPKNRAINLVFHGQSIPAGYGEHNEVHTLDAYPQQLLEKLKVIYPYAVINVINTAVGGENSLVGAQRFERDVLPLKPDVVFIDYSLNELTGDMAAIRSAWEKMIVTAQKNNRKVILMTPSPTQLTDICVSGNVFEKHAEQVRALAKKYHTGLVDSYSIFKEKACKESSLKNYMASVNYPNKAGHELIASAILPWFLLPPISKLALTPPMGWNSWNTFACDINEKLVMETADKLVLTGMKEAGYRYLILDDCWLTKSRDKDSNLVVDPVKFPHGMKALINYVHAKGLKFGLYNCAGSMTCAKFPGTKNHEYQDAAFYASLGIDYLKFDWCNSTGQDARLSYTTMSNALRSTGRPIVFSICEWGKNKPWTWAPGIGELWRTTGDITNSFDNPNGPLRSSGNSLMNIADRQEELRKYAGPGHWNDPDMLEVGNGMTVQQDRTHFSLWAMMAAPLIAGNDITKMSETTKSILTNKKVIAIDQDILGVQGFKATSRDSIETWYKPLANNEWAICIINRSKKTKAVNIDWNELSVTDTLTGKTLDFAKTLYNYDDVWSGLKGNTRGTLKRQLAAQDVLLMRISK